LSRVQKALFRGSEYPKLLVLAATLLIGWPMVVYYGFYSKTPEKPVVPPIASQPKLPPPDSAPAFAGVIDKEPRGFRDDAPLALLFERVRKEPDRLAKEARREVLPIDLLMSPSRFRGLPIRMEGWAQQVYTHDNEDADLTPTGRFYEVWFRSDERRQGTYPVCIFVEDIPSTFPSGRALEERVAIEGYFLKLYAYQAGDVKRFAPLLVGRITHIPNAAAPVHQAQNRYWVAGPLVLLFVYLSGRMFFTLRRNRVRPYERSSSAAPDRIEAQDLQEWLAMPKEPEESPGDGGVT
jgi:hypothetical protein